jgi:hypothetical protein
MRRNHRSSSRRLRRGYGLHFQVYAGFTLIHGKPQLVTTSISSTYAACTTIPIFPYFNTYLTISCIFPTLKIAHSYIVYLHGVYPNSPSLLPVLDGNQKELFTEVSK